MGIVSRIPESASLMRDLRKVNTNINKAVKYVPDSVQFKKQEYWNEADSKGDCEDYAMRKRQELRKLGYPKEALNIACCWVETGEYHAVLVVTTDMGDYVLDNRYDSVMLWRKMPGYKWDRISCEGNITKWRTIE